MLTLIGGGGVPMVDNSIAFAVDRCRQFLHLAKFMRANALRKDAGIRCVSIMFHVQGVPVPEFG